MNCKKNKLHMNLAKTKSGAPDYSKLTWFEPTIQFKISAWTPVNLKEKSDLVEL